MKMTRENLMVSIDNRVTQEHEVLTLKTTSNNDVIILEINGNINKMAVHPDDLMEALVKAKEFIATRPEQPKPLKSVGLVDLAEIEQQETKKQDEFQFLETEISQN